MQSAFKVLLSLPFFKYAQFDTLIRFQQFLNLKSALKILLFCPFSGYIGIVKDATDSTARVELHSSCKTISVDRSRLSNLVYVTISLQIAPFFSCQNTVINSALHFWRILFDFRGGRSVGSAATPGGRTPMHGSQTPMYGSRTPMYGSQTPLHDGSRTPNYGSMTPLHEPGSRTPGQSAWDPTNPNTPTR